MNEAYQQMVEMRLPKLPRTVQIIDGSELTDRLMQAIQFKANGKFPTLGQAAETLRDRGYAAISQQELHEAYDTCCARYDLEKHLESWHPISMLGP
jgi:hypothetical protein